MAVVVDGVRRAHKMFSTTYWSMCLSWKSDWFQIRDNCQTLYSTCYMSFEDGNGFTQGSRLAIVGVVHLSCSGRWSLLLEFHVLVGS